MLGPVDGNGMCPLVDVLTGYTGHLGEPKGRGVRPGADGRRPRGAAGFRPSGVYFGAPAEEVLKAADAKGPSCED